MSGGARTCGCSSTALDPSTAAYVRASSPCSSARMGDVLPNIVWPSDVDDYVASLSPKFDTANAQAACGTLDADTAKAWAGFYQGWLAWKKTASCFFGCANKYSQAQQYESELSQWQTTLAQHGCPLVGPSIVPRDPNTTAIYWVAGAVIVASVAYLASPAVRAVFR